MFEGVLERFMPETTKFEGVYFGYLDSSAADDSGVTAKKTTLAALPATEDARRAVIRAAT